MSNNQNSSDEDLARQAIEETIKDLSQDNIAEAEKKVQTSKYTLAGAVGATAMLLTPLVIKKVVDIVQDTNLLNELIKQGVDQASEQFKNQEHAVAKDKDFGAFAFTAIMMGSLVLSQAQKLYQAKKTVAKLKDTEAQTGVELEENINVTAHSSHTSQSANSTQVSEPSPPMYSTKIKDEELESTLKKFEKIKVIQCGYGDIVFKVEKGLNHIGEIFSASETSLNNLHRGSKVEFKEGHDYAVLPKNNGLTFFQLENKRDRSNSVGGRSV